MLKRTKQPSSNLDLTNRDVAENIWLWRHRQQSDSTSARGRRATSMSQLEAAEKIGLTLTQLTKLENGDSTLTSAQQLAELVAWDGWSKLSVTPTTSELCFLARRRSGMSIKQIANQIGVSTVTFARMEGESDYRVRDFWIGKGYKFQ